VLGLPAARARADALRTQALAALTRAALPHGAALALLADRIVDRHH
jgi:hypothetical protein